MNNTLIETFTIPVTEWKTMDAGKNTIRIKGVALKGDVVSKNDRVYVAKELKKSTNTFIGKPVNIHHNNPENERTNIGNITWMDWDDTAELLTYEAEITKAPYVSMLRSKSAEIRGVSIQAKYLHNLCPDCKTKFYSEETFREHMWGNHFKKVSAVPHGIIGEALTLVLSPEIPGYEGTTVDIAEIARVQTLRLLETVIKTEKEKEEYKLSETQKIKATIAVTPRPEIAVGSVAEIKQEMPKQKEAVTPTQTLQKPEASHTSESTVTVGPAPAIKLGEVTLTESTPTESIEIKPIGRIAKLTEIAIAKLKLGEPFAEYSSFEDCVSKNSDKENPEAYCGTIKHQTEEILSIKKQLSEVKVKLNEIVDVTNSPLSVPKVNESWREQNKQLCEAFVNLQSYVANLPKDNLGWKEIKPFDPTPVNAKIAEVESKIPEAYNDQPLKEAITELRNMNKTLTETVANQKRDFDTLLDSADKSVKEYFAAAKKERDADKAKITELEDKLRTAETKKIEETQKLETRVDNLEDKLQPQWKGKSKGTGTQDNKPVLEDPMKQKEKS